MKRRLEHEISKSEKGELTSGDAQRSIPRLVAVLCIDLETYQDNLAFAWCFLDVQLGDVQSAKWNDRLQMSKLLSQLAGLSTCDSLNNTLDLR